MKSTTLQNILLSVSFTVLFFIATQKVYRLPFSYGDDHRLLAMLHPEKISNSYKAMQYGYTTDLTGSLYKDVQIGRFRPLSWSYDKLLCILCGDNTHFFRLSNLLILFLSSFFLLSIFSSFGVDKPSSVIVLGIYVFGRNNETWWTLIPPPQNIGELFLLAGIYSWLQYRQKGIIGLYVLPALLFLLAGLSKESFIFCIPVILLTDYFFFNPTRHLLAKEYWLSLAAGMLPFIGLLTTVLYIGQVYSYSYPESIWSIFGYNIFQFAGATGFFLAPILLLAINKKFRESSFLIKLLFVFVLWTIIQLVLLKGIKLNDQHHYLIPWLIYPLIITAVALSELRKLRKKWYTGMLIVYGIAILLFAKNTYANSSSYSATLQAYYKMIDTIKKDTTAPEVVYLSDEACLGDWIEGTRAIMDNKGIRKELYFATTATSPPPWQVAFANHSRQNAYRHIPLDSVFYPDGKWIIFVETPAKNGTINDSISFYKRSDSSFVKLNGKQQYIAGKYYYFSVSYPGRSIGDMIRGNFSAENRKGFYAIKLNKEN